MGARPLRVEHVGRRARTRRACAGRCRRGAASTTRCCRKLAERAVRAADLVPPLGERRRRRRGRRTARGRGRTGTSARGKKRQTTSSADTESATRPTGLLVSRMPTKAIVLAGHPEVAPRALLGRPSAGRGAPARRGRGRSRARAGSRASRVMPGPASQPGDERVGRAGRPSSPARRCRRPRWRPRASATTCTARSTSEPRERAVDDART